MVSVKQNVSPKKQKNNLKKLTKVKKIKNEKSVPQLVKPPPEEHTLTVKPSTPVMQENEAKTQVKKKNVKYVMPSKAVTEELVKSCLNALLKVIVANDKQKKAIFDDEKPIFAEFHCIKIQNTTGNIKFQLPHNTISSTGEVCLVIPDIKKGRKHDHEPTIDRWEEILRKAGVTEVKTILPVRQLRVEYDQYELKRRLLTQHDFIMVDTRVLNHVSHILGKMFFKKHNMLIPVRINEEKDVKKSIDKGLHTAVMRLSEGETATITIGHTAMPQEKVKDNILALIKQLESKYPGGEANVRAISIKLPLSISLPLYLTLRPSSTVRPPKLTQKRPKHYTVLEDELSTMPGRQVRVAPDGTVQLKKQKKNPKISKNKQVKKQVSDDEESDNEEESDVEEQDEELNDSD